MVPSFKSLLQTILFATHFYHIRLVRSMNLQTRNQLVYKYIFGRDYCLDQPSTDLERNLCLSLSLILGEFLTDVQYLRVMSPPSCVRYAMS